ncbi:hypothetical protein L228DRAFT_239231 [Xylona heveae TC161]|uniref:Steroid 5-alpha reductase C-terminal domain-containing protein n=1 Tax=Xylona heveae (strain CBS 132557 / TC161) TaxID=1328760 RepID=A0A165GIW6_XYLHT|nr:hypothetical protein L228DRAFT_239231 [Xylona heveae TC161]KZF22239.1 hypothetical protein L228DRAFT_239231 [Xylona heveae TC161]
MPRAPRADALREKGPTPIGTAVFTGLRAADPFLQYAILRNGWGIRLIEYFGGRAIQPLNLSSAGVLGLQPYYAVIVGLSVGSAFKHITWRLGIAEQKMPVWAALFIGAFNSFFNTLNTILSLWSVTSMAPLSLHGWQGLSADKLPTSPVFWAGVGLFVTGISMELISEFQRKAFKADPKNEGKPYGGGLFTFARHINLGGYVTWRTGYALAAAGLPLGLFTGGFLLYDFTHRAVPSVDEYCTKRYGEEWKAIKQRVPYRLIPGIY